MKGKREENEIHTVSILYHLYRQYLILMYKLVSYQAGFIPLLHVYSALNSSSELPEEGENL